MLREMRPEGGACCEEHTQPGMQRHMHAGAHHQHEFPIRLDVESREDVFVISVTPARIETRGCEHPDHRRGCFDPGRDQAGRG